MNERLEEIITNLTKKKVGWIMEIMEMDEASNDAKLRVKKAMWTLTDEIKESLNQAKFQNDNQITKRA